MDHKIWLVNSGAQCCEQRVFRRLQRVFGPQVWNRPSGVRNDSYIEAGVEFLQKIPALVVAHGEIISTSRRPSRKTQKIGLKVTQHTGGIPDYGDRRIGR